MILKMIKDEGVNHCDEKLGYVLLLKQGPMTQTIYIPSRLALDALCELARTFLEPGKMVDVSEIDTHFWKESAMKRSGGE